jgi:hypothetical protein
MLGRIAGLPFRQRDSSCHAGSPRADLDACQTVVLYRQETIHPEQDSPIASGLLDGRLFGIAPPSCRVHGRAKSEAAGSRWRHLGGHRLAGPSNGLRPNIPMTVWCHCTLLPQALHVPEKCRCASSRVRRPGPSVPTGPPQFPQFAAMHSSAPDENCTTRKKV